MMTELVLSVLKLLSVILSLTADCSQDRCTWDLHDIHCHSSLLAFSVFGWLLDRSKWWKNRRYVALFEIMNLVYSFGISTFCFSLPLNPLLLWRCLVNLPSELNIIWETILLLFRSFSYKLLFFVCSCFLFQQSELKNCSSYPQIAPCPRFFC